MSKYPTLFSPVKVGGLHIKNRIEMSPMGTISANADGTINNTFIEYYAERARGGAGLIVVEVTAVDYYNAGRGSPRQVRLTESGQICEWMNLANAVHAHGAKIFPQLHHPGNQTSAAATSGVQPVSASDGSSPSYGKYRGLTNGEVKALEQKFVVSAKLAQLAGLDGVQLHAGHGYIINQFMSPLTNRRTDEYGGSAENRVRFLCNIVRGIKAACGSVFPISVRFALNDAAPGGITTEEGIEMAKLADAAGVDIFDLTAGIAGPSIEQLMETQHEPQGNRIYMAKALRPHVKAAVSVVGKIKSPAMMEQILSEDTADMVTIGRQFICDPYWALKTETGREDEVRTCISCSEGCFGNLIANHSMMDCALNPYILRETSFKENDPVPAAKPKKVIVVGGGIAGMQAAITAAKRGHSVTLLEASDKLGGQINLAIVPPDKEDLLTIIPWFTAEMKRQGVEVKTGVEATADSIAAIMPDAVIVATGSEPLTPPIKGIEKAVENWDVLTGKAVIPDNKNIVFIGGGTVACETALYLADKSASIQILEMLDVLARGQELCHKVVMTKMFVKKGIKSTLNATVKEIREDCVVYTDAGGKEISVPCDVAIVSTGQKPVGGDLERRLRACGINCRTAGDAKGVGNIRSAVRSGFDVAYYI